MSPADAFVWAVVAATAAWLVVSTVVPVTLQGLLALARRVRPLSRPIATVVAAILLVGVVRSSPSAAVVPPPVQRIIIDQQPAPTAVTVRSPVSRVATLGSTGSAYMVVSGDTLWGIARDFLSQNGSHPDGGAVSVAWRTIYESNTDVVGADPNLILPGQVLTIPGGLHG
jgi:nucleoid-associated protein YgaU